MTEHLPGTPGEPSAASRPREVALGVVSFAVGAGVFLLARSIVLPDRPTAISPRAWPEALGIGIMALSVLQIVASFTTHPPAEDIEPATRTGVIRMVGFVAAILAFGVLWYYVHFLVSATLFVAALTWIAGGRGIRDLLLFPLAITVVLYVLFSLLLKVPI